MPKYFTTDGRAMVRIFDTEPDALIFWAYHSCKGDLQEIQDGTGIVMDQCDPARMVWVSGRQPNYGPHLQTIIAFRGRQEPVHACAPHMQSSSIPHTLSSPVQVQAQVLHPPVQKGTTEVDSPQPQAQQSTVPIQATVPVQQQDGPTLSADAEGKLAEEIRRLQAFVDVSADELSVKEADLIRKMEEQAIDRNRVEQAKMLLRREQEREEESQRVFESGKHTYRMLKREVCTGQTKEMDIPDIFRERYQVYKLMDERGFLDMPDEWEQYKQITDDIKIDRFLADRDTYYELRDKIEAGEMKKTDIEAEFIKIYDVCSVLDDQEVLEDNEVYPMFLDLLKDYMTQLHDIKYGFMDDTNYMSDINIDPRNRNTNTVSGDSPSIDSTLSDAQNDSSSDNVTQLSRSAVPDNTESEDLENSGDDADSSDDNQSEQVQGYDADEHTGEALAYNSVPTQHSAKDLFNTTISGSFLDL